MCKMVANLSNITTVILAGGLGTRLRTAIPGRPKVLAEIHNRPFLTFLLDQLVSAGARNVVLCTGYMADEIHEKLGKVYKSLRLVYSKEDEPLGTGGALRLALPYLNSDPVLVMNGDSFVKVDLTGYLNWFFEKDIQASLILTKVRDTGRYGRVLMDKDGRITHFEEKGGSSGEGWINAGIYLLNRRLLRTIPVSVAVSLEREMFPSWIGRELYGYRSEGYFIDIGTPETYVKAEEFFAEEECL